MSFCIRQGIDFIHIPRFQKKCERNPHLLTVFFTASEKSYCEKKRYKFEHYAARFAAKKAALKALGPPQKIKFSYLDLEIKHQPTGKPYLRISKQLLRQLSYKNPQIEISLSHERSYALAGAVLHEKL